MFVACHVMHRWSDGAVEGSHDHFGEQSAGGNMTCNSVH